MKMLAKFREEGKLRVLSVDEKQILKGGADRSNTGARGGGGSGGSTPPDDWGG